MCTQNASNKNISASYRLLHMSLGCQFLKRIKREYFDKGEKNLMEKKLPFLYKKPTLRRLCWLLKICLGWHFFLQYESILKILSLQNLMTKWQFVRRPTTHFSWVRLISFGGSRKDYVCRLYFQLIIYYKVYVLVAQ